MRASPQQRRGRGRGGEAYSPSPPGAPQSPSRSLALKKAQLLRTVQGYNVHLLPLSSASSYSTTTEPSIPPPPSVASASPSSPLLLSKGRGEDPEGAFSSA